FLTIAELAELIVTTAVGSAIESNCAAVISIPALDELHEPSGSTRSRRRGRLTSKEKNEAGDCHATQLKSLHRSWPLHAARLTQVARRTSNGMVVLPQAALHE